MAHKTAVSVISNKMGAITMVRRTEAMAGTTGASIAEAMVDTLKAIWAVLEALKDKVNGARTMGHSTEAMVDITEDSMEATAETPKGTWVVVVSEALKVVKG